ncbi:MULTISPECIES: hypothetical protein [Thalassospira]|nr:MULTISPECIES: hypothetical protein [Thalassospira]
MHDKSSFNARILAVKRACIQGVIGARLTSPDSFWQGFGGALGWR